MWTFQNMWVLLLLHLTNKIPFLDVYGDINLGFMGFDHVTNQMLYFHLIPIFQTRSFLFSSVIDKKHRYEYCPSKNSMNWRNRENDGVYIFFLTLRRLEIWHDSYSSKNILSIMRKGSRLYITHVCGFMHLLKKDLKGN